RTPEMRNTLLVFVVALGLSLGAGTLAVRAEGPGGPFIDKDLRGWEGLTEYWSFREGTLVGATPKGLSFNTFLCSKKPCSDFELSFQVRLKDGQGNSGVQIRSEVFDRKH